MHSYFFTFTNVVWIVAVASTVKGHGPFSFLPRFALERSAERRSVDRQISQPSNFLSSLSDYESAEILKPVESWTKITQNPVNGIETTVGSRVELKCRVSGSPPPEVFWFTGTGTNEQLLEYVKGNTQNLYDPAEEWKGVARVNSKLVIDCVTPEDSGLRIYCASVAEREIKISTPTVLIVNGERGNNCSTESEPTITLYSPTRVANIGSTVILPCRASGKPVPTISWYDNHDLPLSVTANPRHRVLDSGDLLIEELLWEDMGGYTCKATAGHQQRVVSTFLYPMSPETKVDRTGN